MFWVIVLLLLIGGGFYAYHKLREIEREILAEQALAQQQHKDETESGDDREEQPPVVAESAVKSAEAEDVDAVAAILTVVKEEPGVVQSELYQRFSDLNKKQFQQLIKQLADEGRLKRTPHRNSFQLYPA